MAEKLTAAGFRIAPATLARLASQGGGPPFRRWGRTPYYDPQAALAWANTRLSSPLRDRRRGVAG